MNKLNVNFLGIDFDNPILTSSGCFGFGLEYKDYFNPNELGGIVLKGLTLEPRTGNLGTRIAETPSGILNCVGLENPGIEVLEKEIIPNLKKQGINTKIIVNINGSTIEQYVEIAKRVNKIKEIDMVELNISCPNVKDGGMAFGANPEVAGKATREVRKVLNKPLIVKLSPNVTNIVEIAKIVEANGADAISMINTLLGMRIDINKGTPILGNTFGGLSGPAVRPVAVRMVYQVAQNVNIPIVGMGGINSWEDAVEFIMAGATMVSIGTGIFPNPLLPIEVKQGLNDYCVKNNLNNLQDIKGIAFKK
ncbi:dihydroorotate dehydrogenase [Fusobacterium sp. MFO224]|uniref:dihydroorotate dehydrogenase n=1 Tax=Fusobacterium sp. MFO224 TaxID=3378070 RepID=UPI003854C017